jgi:hypothetical protein
MGRDTGGRCGGVRAELSVDTKSGEISDTMRPKTTAVKRT